MGNVLLEVCFYLSLDLQTYPKVIGICSRILAYLYTCVSKSKGRAGKSCCVIPDISVPPQWRCLWTQNASSSRGKRGRGSFALFSYSPNLSQDWKIHMGRFIGCRPLYKYYLELYNHFLTLLEIFDIILTEVTTIDKAA